MRCRDLARDGAEAAESLNQRCQDIPHRPHANDNITAAAPESAPGPCMEPDGMYAVGQPRCRWGENDISQAVPRFNNNPHNNASQQNLPANAEIGESPEDRP
jgi:hypothetical protein